MPEAQLLSKYSSLVRTILSRLISPFAHLRPIGLLIIYAIMVAGCYDRDDDTMYPYRLEHEWVAGEWNTVADLDFDGSDEIVHRVPSPSGLGIERWLITESDGAVIDQINIPGKVLGHPSFSEINEDDAELEILFGVNRSDSLFLYVFTKYGQSVDEPLFITSGEKRVDPNGTTFDWEAEAWFSLIDVGGDSKKELVTVVNSTYAGLPRGVFVHELSTGREIGRLILGAPIVNPILVDDLDEDGVLEAIFYSGISNHGVDAGGLNDGEGYLLSVQLDESPELEWWDSSEIPDMRFQAFVGTFSSARGRQMIAVSIQNRSTRSAQSELRVYEIGRPLQGQNPVITMIPGMVLSSASGDLDRDGILEIYTLNRRGELVRYDYNRPVQIATFQGAHHVQTVADITGDGNPELLLQIADNRSYLLNREFEVILTSDKSIRESSIQKPGGERDIIVGREVSSVARNSLYLLNRYGDEGGIGLVLMILLVGFVFALKRVRAASQMELFQMDFGALSSPVYRIDVSHGAIALNQSATDFGNLFERLPNLRVGNSNGASIPDSPHAISTRLNGEGLVTCIVFPVGSSGHLLFLVPSESVDSVEGWRRMTSRIAHDIKNPLTSILLTVQRLQVESETLGPDAQVSIQPLLGRIEDRIEHLRRKSRQIMKVVGTVEETPAAIKINDVLTRVIESLRGGIPGDIDIIEKLEEGLPIVVFDPDLLESVIDNILMNAVQAMPTGGRLTVKSELMENVRVNEVDEANSYVCVSISDTGEGISSRDIEHVFDSGFSTRADGSGLGLTFVRRIMEQSGGNIEIESVVGSGTEFIFFFRVING